MKKTCNFCGKSDFTKKRVQYIYRHKGKFLVVNQVPCESCDGCGEQYFEAAVLKKIEEEFEAIHDAGKKARNEIVVPVEEFVEIGS